MDSKKLEEVFTQTKVNAPLQQIHEPFLAASDISLFLKREDRIHPHVSGNKWRKLKYNLIQAASDNHETLLTFGGAYSNHILATAHAGRLFGFRTIGIIRGEEYSPLNPVLAEAQQAGMDLHYLPRWRYRLKESSEVKEELIKRFGDFYLLPEGGTNALAVKGCSEIVGDIEQPFDLICCACGTGGTLAGLISGLEGEQKAMGVAVLKGESFLKRDVSALLTPNSVPPWEITFDYHMGGYAKSSSGLREFIDRFYRTHNIQLDPVYTGKLMFGLYDMIQKGLIPPRQTIIAIHTGKNKDINDAI